MSQTPSSPNDPMSNPPPAVGASTAPVAGAVAMDPKEVADGKVLAILSYIFWPVAVVVLIIRNNAFALYHAKQDLTVCIALIAAEIVNIILGIVLSMIYAPLGCVSLVIHFVLILGGLTLIIFGIINSANGVAKPLPVLGQYADKIFGGVQKKAA